MKAFLHFTRQMIVYAFMFLFLIYYFITLYELMMLYGVKWLVG